jgi:O-antigen/teichoic acid export membrane protein
LSKWSEDVVQKRFSVKKMNQTILGVLIITFSIFLLVLLFRSQVVYLLYPKILASDRNLIALVLVLNMAGFIFNSSNQVINRATLAFKSTSILIRISVIKSIINIVMDVVLALKFGVVGIAVSTIIVHLSGFLMNYYLFQAEQKKLMLKPI